MCLSLLLRDTRRASHFNGNETAHSKVRRFIFERQMNGLVRFCPNVKLQTSSLLPSSWRKIIPLVHCREPSATGTPKEIT